MIGALDLVGDLASAAGKIAEASKRDPIAARIRAGTAAETARSRISRRQVARWRRSVSRALARFRAAVEANDEGAIVAAILDLRTLGIDDEDFAEAKRIAESLD